MPKGHKPGESSKKYKIRGTAGSSRRQQPTTRQAHNKELRTLRCRGCGAERKKGSGPFCPNCSITITERGA